MPLATVKRATGRQPRASRGAAQHPARFASRVRRGGQRSRV